MLVSFREFKAVHDKIEDIMQSVDNMACSTDEYKLQRKLCPNHISVDEIILRNSQLFLASQLNENNTYRLVFDVDRKMSSFFPIIGQGSEALVFNIGNKCVLKRRISEGRAWECDLRIMARARPGMYADEISIGTNESGDYNLEVQEFLMPIDALRNRKLIEQCWFPDSTEDKVPEFAYWEWGIDAAGIPRVIDWG